MFRLFIVGERQGDEEREREREREEYKDTGLGLDEVVTEDVGGGEIGVEHAPGYVRDGLAACQRGISYCCHKMFF